MIVVIAESWEHSVYIMSTHICLSLVVDTTLWKNVSVSSLSLGSRGFLTSSEQQHQTLFFFILQWQSPSGWRWATRSRSLSLHLCRVCMCALFWINTYWIYWGWPWKCACDSDTAWPTFWQAAMVSLISLESLFIKLSLVEEDQCFCPC